METETLILQGRKGPDLQQKVDGTRISDGLRLFPCTGEPSWSDCSGQGSSGTGCPMTMSTSGRCVGVAEVSEQPGL